MIYTVSIPKELHAESKRFAESKGLTFSGLLQLLLSQMLKRQVEKDASKTV
jgi:hypothetical protein